jgi:hypothetical protein
MGAFGTETNLRKWAVREKNTIVYAQDRNNITQDKISISSSTQQLINTIFVDKTNQTVQTLFPYTSLVIYSTYNGL